MFAQEPFIKYRSLLFVKEISSARMGNGKWENEEWEMGNGKMENGKWENEEWEIENERINLFFFDLLFDMGY